MQCGADLTATSPAVNPAPPATSTSVQPPTSSPARKKRGLATVLLGIVGVSIIGLFVLAVIGGGVWWLFLKDNGKQDQAQTTTLEGDAKVEVSYEVTDRVPTAFYNNADTELIVVTLKSDRKTKVKIEVEIPNVTEKTTKEVEVGTTEIKEKIKPPILKSAYGPLDKAQQKPVQVKITDVNSGVVVTDGSKNVTLLSRNDMVWVSQDGYQNYKYIARWVTKDNKEVKELVRLAAEYNEQFCGQHAMVGYLGGEIMVECQLASIFAAMQDYYNIAYVASTESYTTTNAQSVKLPEEVLMENSGLCIDLAITVAAALESLDMEPVIIFIPGHAWVAVKTYAGSPSYYHLESTMLDSSVIDALDQGDQNWWQNSNQATVIDIKEARKEGILPYGEVETTPEKM